MAGHSGTGANLLTLAGVLWKAYERYVKPKRDRTDKTAKPFLFINLRRSDGKFVQFTLGNEHKNKEIFLEQFTRQVTELRAEAGPHEDSSLLSEFTQNEGLLRVQIRNRKDSNH